MLWLFFFLHFAHAEYRAFELVISNPTTGQERVQRSSLDPQQYRRYYPVKVDESVVYRATWMCRGNTSHRKPICPQPEVLKPQAPPTQNANP
jgi:hypothetical protein